MSTEKLHFDIGNRILEVRRSRGLTQKDFAESIGISQSTLSEIENGKYDPSGPIVIALSLRYSIRDHWLLKGEGEMFMSKDPSDEPMSPGPAESDLSAHDIRGLHVKVEYILASNTIYSKALALNIEAFHQALTDSQTIPRLLEEIDSRISARVNTRFEELEKRMGKGTQGPDVEETEPMEMSSG